MAVAPGVVVAGEALMDLVYEPDGRLAPVPGGGPFNVARTLGRLGQPTSFLGCVSRDALGRRIADALTADGVFVDERLRVDLPTSLAIAELDASGAASYRFYFARASAEALEPDLALAALPARPSALVVGGLGLLLEPLAHASEALVERMAGECLVMVDPNVRPAVIPDLAAYRRRLAGTLGLADVVKVSDDDLRLLDPSRSPEAAAEALLARGAKLVLLTRGAQGAAAHGGFGWLESPAPAVQVVDTIGAGDIFSGAWLARWLELHRPLTDSAAVAEALQFALRAASLSCAHRGATPPTRAQIDGSFSGDKQQG